MGGPMGTGRRTTCPSSSRSICDQGNPMSDDFWPSFAPVDALRSPALQLKEQAAALRKKTSGLVYGSVFAEPTEEGGFRVLLLLESPYLERYHYQLLSMEYPVAGYPLTIRAGDESLQVNNPDELRKALSRLLGSERTREIVEAIMAHAAAVGP